MGPDSRHHPVFGPNLRGPLGGASGPEHWQAMIQPERRSAGECRDARALLEGGGEAAHHLGADPHSSDGWDGCVRVDGLRAVVRGDGHKTHVVLDHHRMSYRPMEKSMEHVLVRVYAPWSLCAGWRGPRHAGSSRCHPK